METSLFSPIKDPRPPHSLHYNISAVNMTNLFGFKFFLLIYYLINSLK